MTRTSKWRGTETSTCTLHLGVSFSIFLFFFFFRGHQYGKVIKSLRLTFWNPLRWVLISEICKLKCLCHDCVHLLFFSFTYPVVVMGKKIFEVNFLNKIWDWDLPGFVNSDPLWIDSTIFSLLCCSIIGNDLFILFWIWTANGDRGKQRDNDGENVS